MKDYISKNWKKIIIAIGSFAVLFILVFKITAEKTLLRDYIKYGKDLTPSQNEIIDAATSNVSSVWGSVNPDLAKLGIVFIVAITIVVFLSALATKAGEKKDAKKK